MRKKTASWALFVCDSSSKIKLWLPLGCGMLEQVTQCGSQRLGDSSTDWLSCQITSEPWISSWSAYSKPYFSPILLYLWPLQCAASKNICPRIPMASLLFFPPFPQAIPGVATRWRKAITMVLCQRGCPSVCGQGSGKLASHLLQASD